MSHRLRHERQPEYTGELTLALASDGTLHFEGGIATVDSAACAERMADRYAPLDYVGPTNEGDDDDNEGFDAEVFVDRAPVSDVADDIKSGEYDERLDEILAAEQENRDRKTVQEAVKERR